MIDPGLAKPGEGVRVGVKDCVRLDDKLSGAQMPPHVRISHTARRHSEKAKSKDGYKYTARLKKLHHQSEDNTSPGFPQYKIASRLPEKLT
jgi:hypothetical protein